MHGHNVVVVVAVVVKESFGSEGRLRPLLVLVGRARPAAEHGGHQLAHVGKLQQVVKYSTSDQKIFKVCLF